MKYSDLNPFTKGYIDAMFWTECHSDHPELEDKTFIDLAPETLTRIIEDCAGFEMLHKKLLDSVMRDDYGLESAGHDFWLTRNGHGAGFWDRNLGEAGDKLTAACGHGTRYPEQNLYVGDDGRLWL
jgi:hypothetical protein